MFTFGIVGGASLLLTGVMLGILFLIIRSIMKRMK